MDEKVVFILDGETISLEDIHVSHLEGALARHKHAAIENMLTAKIDPQTRKIINSLIIEIDRRNTNAKIQSILPD